MKWLMRFCPYPMPSMSYQWLVLLSAGIGDSSDLPSWCKFKAALLEKQNQNKTETQPNTPPPKASQNLFRNLLIPSVHRENAGLEQKLISLFLLTLILPYELTSNVIV